MQLQFCNNPHQSPLKSKLSHSNANNEPSQSPILETTVQPGLHLCLFFWLGFGSVWGAANRFLRNVKLALLFSHQFDASVLWILPPQLVDSVQLIMYTFSDRSTNVCILSSIATLLKDVFLRPYVCLIMQQCQTIVDPIDSESSKNGCLSPSYYNLTNYLGNRG